MISVQVVVGGGNNSKLQTEGRPGSAGLTGVWSLVQEFAAIFAGRTVIERAVWADVVVFVTEGAAIRWRSDGVMCKFSTRPLEGESGPLRIVPPPPNYIRQKMCARFPTLSPCREFTRDPVGSRPARGMSAKRIASGRWVRLFDFVHGSGSKPLPEMAILRC